MSPEKMLNDVFADSQHIIPSCCRYRSTSSQKKKNTSHRMKNTTWLIAVPENVVAHNPRHLQKLGDTLPAAGDEGPEGHHGCGAVKEKYVV